MALVIADRVRETTTTAGTGTVTLAGAVTGYQSFSVIGNGNTTYYTIAGQNTSEWEVGIGTYTSSGTTLSRDTVLASSNSGSLVVFSSGTKDVFVTYPAGKAIYTNGAGTQITATGTLAATNGGTGQSSYAVGDLLYASTTSALSKLTDVATGNALISGGVGVAPSYGKIGLTTHVSGTLPTANGGTNLTSFTANGVMYASSTSALATGSALQWTGTNLSVGGGAQTPSVAVTFSATAMTVNCAISNVFTTTFTANVTTAPTLSNPSDGQTINWFITQNGTGGWTMTWPTSFKWAGGTAGVLSTGANAVDLLVATYRSSTGFWYASLSKGFA